MVNLIIERFPAFYHSQVFLVDDVGWAECGFQGSKDIPTPHIDSIADGSTDTDAKGATLAVTEVGIETTASIGGSSTIGANLGDDLIGPEPRDGRDGHAGKGADGTVRSRGRAFTRVAN